MYWIGVQYCKLIEWLGDTLAQPIQTICLLFLLISIIIICGLSITTLIIIGIIFGIAYILKLLLNFNKSFYGYVLHNILKWHLFLIIIKINNDFYEIMPIFSMDGNRMYIAFYNNHIIIEKFNKLSDGVPEKKFELSLTNPNSITTMRNIILTSI